MAIGSAWTAREKGQRLVTRGGLDHLVARFHQNASHHLAEDDLVVGDRRLHRPRATETRLSPRVHREGLLPKGGALFWNAEGGKGFTLIARQVQHAQEGMAKDEPLRHLGSVHPGHHDVDKHIVDLLGMLVAEGQPIVRVRRRQHAVSQRLQCVGQK